MEGYRRFDAAATMIQRRTWFSVLIAGLIGAVLLASPLFRYVIWFEYFRIREHLSRVPFEAEPWREYRREFGPIVMTNYWAYALPIRLRMVDDLITRQILDGKSRSEVVALLGENVETAYFQEWDLVYFLGPGRYGNAIGDSEWLVIRFRSDGTVGHYAVVHD